MCACKNKKKHTPVHWNAVPAKNKKKSYCTCTACTPQKPQHTWKYLTCPPPNPRHTAHHGGTFSGAQRKQHHVPDGRLHKSHHNSSKPIKTQGHASTPPKHQRGVTESAEKAKNKNTYLNAAVLVQTIDAEAVLVLAVKCEDLARRCVRQTDRARCGRASRACGKAGVNRTAQKKTPRNAPVPPPKQINKYFSIYIYCMENIKKLFVVIALNTCRLLPAKRVYIARAKEIPGAIILEGRKEGSTG